MKRTLIGPGPRLRLPVSVVALMCMACSAFFRPACSYAGLVITPTFTNDFDADFGANATAARNAFIAAANIFSSNFSDNIHINITVDASPPGNIIKASFTPLVGASYTTLRERLVADATTGDDATAIGAGGSMTIADPTGGASGWAVTRAQAKAIGLIPDDLSNDGTIAFYAGTPFSFSGAPPAGSVDFQGTAAYYISNLMGRINISFGSSPSYGLIDNYSYTGAGTKALLLGSGDSFSIDNGTTLLTQFANGLRDWATGTPDAFNQFSGLADPGMLNPVSTVDLELMDVLGYDRITVPELPAISLAALALLALVGYSRRGRGALQPKS